MIVWFWKWESLPRPQDESDLCWHLVDLKQPFNNQNQPFNSNYGGFAAALWVTMIICKQNPKKLLWILFFFVVFKYFKITKASTQRCYLSEHCEIH